VKASTRSNINHCMQGVKKAFNDFREKDDPRDSIASWRVFVTDEVDLTNSKDASSGERGLAVGKTKPFHAETNSPHLTALPIVSFREGVFCNTFIYAGAPMLPEGSDAHNRGNSHTSFQI
jgi:hypothetical protein